MKSAATIERQEERKKDEKDAEASGSDGRSSTHFKGPVSKARAVANLKPYQFKPGQSGNAGGVPKYDVAGELTRAVIEGNQELIYKAFVKALSKGNAYAFQVLADRGYAS